VVEAMMRGAIRKLGNSSGIIIPKSLLAEIGVAAGDTVDLSLEDGRIAITPVKRRPREGWAAAFAEIGELRDDDLAWLQFGNEGDDELQW
jgi:antitoxin MazE